MVAAAAAVVANTSSNSDKEDGRRQRCSAAWMQTIVDAGQTIATARDEQVLWTEIQRLEACREYLESQKRHWYHAPKRMPPTAETQEDQDPDGDTTNHNNNFGGLVPASVVVASTCHSHTNNGGSAFATRNPFAAFEDDDDSDADEPNEETANANEEVAPLPVPAASPTLYTMRRLLIRVLTTLCELQARVTNMRRQDRDERYWTEGTDAYATVVECLLSALIMADEEYARLYPQANPEEEEDHAATTTDTLMSMQQLADDAQVVMIALEHVTRERTHFHGLVQRRMEYLQSVLAPQWTARDQVKEKLGKERWENNPSPKMDYARQRQDQEQELKALEVALGRLEAIKNSLEGAYQRTQTIYKQTAAQKDDDDMAAETTPAHRYNGIRPGHNKYHNQQRVSLEDYPDPTDFGWTFTGSVQASFVEFFERTMVDDDDGLVVKLDWYYTTATIKTSMDHPTRGPNQLFGKQVTPLEYRQILENPRAHTNVRYRTRDNNKNGNDPNNDHGRGSRGGGRNASGGRGRGRGGRGRGRGGRGRGSNGFGRGGRT